MKSYFCYCNTTIRPILINSSYPHHILSSLTLDAHMRKYIDAVLSGKVKLVSRSFNTLDYIPDMTDTGNHIPAEFKNTALFLEVAEDAPFRFKNGSRWILVRSVYKEIYDQIISLDDTREAASRGVPVPRDHPYYKFRTMYSQITGCQGIGKSYWAYYFLFRALTKENPDPVVIINLFGKVDKTSLSSSVSRKSLMYAEHSTGSQSKPWVILDSVAEVELKSLINISDLRGRIIFVASDRCHGVSPGLTYCQHLMMHPASLPESVAVALCPRTISTDTVPQLPRHTLFVTPLSVVFLRYMAFNGILQRIAHSSMSIPVPADDPCCYWGKATDVSSDTEPPLLIHPRDPVLYGGEPANKNLRCRIYASAFSPLPAISCSFLSPRQLSSQLYSFTTSKHVLVTSAPSDNVVCSMRALCTSLLGRIGISTAHVGFAIRAIKDPMNDITQYFDAAEDVRDMLLRGSVSYPLFTDFSPKHAFLGDDDLIPPPPPDQMEQAHRLVFLSSTFSGRYMFDKCSDPGFRDKPKIYIESRTVMSPFILMWLENVSSELYSGLIETLRKTISFSGTTGLFETCYSSQASTKLFSTPLQTYSNGWSGTGDFVWKSGEIFPEVNRGAPLQSKFNHNTGTLPYLRPNHYYDCANGQKWIDGIAVLHEVTPILNNVRGKRGCAILLFQHTINEDHDNDTASYKLLVDALLKKFKANYYQTILVMPCGQMPGSGMFDRYTLSSHSSRLLPARDVKKSAKSLIAHKQAGVPDVTLCQLNVRDMTYYRYSHNSLDFDLSSWDVSSITR
jgi:hypothetical protein